jgi:MFS family permease
VREVLHSSDWCVIRVHAATLFPLRKLCGDLCRLLPYAMLPPHCLSQVALLISATTAAIVYTVAGTVPPDYAGVLVGLAVVGTFSGQIIFAWIVRRTGRASVLVIVLTVLIVAGVFGAGAVVVRTALRLAADPSQLAVLRGVCVSCR